MQTPAHDLHIRFFHPCGEKCVYQVHSDFPDMLFWLAVFLDARCVLFSDHFIYNAVHWLATDFSVWVARCSLHNLFKMVLTLLFTPIAHMSVYVNTLNQALRNATHIRRAHFGWRTYASNLPLFARSAVGRV